MPIPEPVVLVWYLSDIRFKYITFTFGDREPLTARGFKKNCKSLKIFGKYVFFFNACSASCKIGFSSFVGESAKASCIAVNNFTSEGIFCVWFF